MHSNLSASIINPSFPTWHVVDKQAAVQQIIILELSRIATLIVLLMFMNVKFWVHRVVKQAELANSSGHGCHIWNLSIDFDLHCDE